MQVRIYLLTLTILTLTACTTRLVSLPDLTQIASSTPLPTIDFRKISAEVTLYPVETTPELATSVSIPPEVTQAFNSFTDGFIMKAKNNLNQQTGISMEKIKVQSVEAVVWPDGSLGCGKPGTEYLQVVTPGFLIVLEADGKIYDYHTDMSNQIVLCSEKLPIRISPIP